MRHARLPVLPAFAVSIAGALLAPGCARSRDGLSRDGLSRDVGAFCRLDRAAPELVPPANDAFFAGLEVLAHTLPTVPGQPASPVSSIRSSRFEALEDAFRPVLPSVGLARTGSFFVHGLSLHVDASPQRCADLLIDVEVERTVLGAEEGRVEGEVIDPRTHVRRRTGRFGLLDMGEGPFRFDYRWTMDAQRAVRPDGACLVRYDLRREIATEHVSAFSGVAIAVPEGTGTRLTEIVAIGSTLRAPFFLKARAREAVADILSRRMQRLVGQMTAR